MIVNVRNLTGNKPMPAPKISSLNYHFGQHKPQALLGEKSNEEIHRL